MLSDPPYYQTPIPQTNQPVPFRPTCTIDGCNCKANYFPDKSRFANPKGQVAKRAVLILVPTRLGVDRVDPKYFPIIRSFFNSPLFVGFVGGHPGAAHYFFAMQNSCLFYLDPHWTRQGQEITYVPQEEPPPSGNLLDDISPTNRQFYQNSSSYADGNQEGEEVEEEEGGERGRR